MRLPLVITSALVLLGIGIGLGFWLSHDQIHQSTTTGAAVTQSESDPPLAGVRSAAADVRASIGIGVSFSDYQTKLQRLSTEILLVQQAGADVSKYNDLLSLYHEALAIWETKVRCNPDALRPAGMFEICADSAKSMTRLAGLPVPNIPNRWPYDLDSFFEAAMQAYWNKAADKMDEINGRLSLPPR